MQGGCLLRLLRGQPVVHDQPAFVEAEVERDAVERQ